MTRRTPRSTRTDTPFPYTTLFRSGSHEGLERLHAGQISDDLIFALFEAENRIDQVVSNTSFALLHLEPVDEKVRDGAKQLRSHKLGQPDFVNSSARALFLLQAYEMPDPGSRIVQLKSQTIAKNKFDNAERFATQCKGVSRKIGRAHVSHQVTNAHLI